MSKCIHSLDLNPSSPLGLSIITLGLRDSRSSLTSCSSSLKFPQENNIGSVITLIGSSHKKKNQPDMLNKTCNCILF